MTSKTINILLAEDNQGDYLFIKEMIGEAPFKYSLEWRQTLSDGIKFLENEPCDAIILDLELPDSNGLETLSRIISLKTDCAIIVLTGNTNEQQALNALKAGAHDCVIKGSLQPGFLPRVIRYAVERKETEKILISHQEILEKEVSKRTLELINSNCKLKEEIEARIKTEKDLVESEESFRLISTSAKDAIVKMDCQGKVAFWNFAAERIFGFTANEIIGKNAHELLALPESIKKAQTAMQSFLNTGKGKLVGKTVELAAKKKDGTIIPIEISLSALKVNDKNYQAVAIIRDISERKLTENKIKQTNYFLQTIIDAIPVPVFYKDIHAKHRGGNKAFFDFIGKKPEDAIGRNTGDIICVDQFAANFLHRDNELIQNFTDKLYYESEAVNTLGEIRKVEIHKASYKNEAGETAGILGVLFDITDSRKLTMELSALKENLEKIVETRTAELREANATKDKFFSIIAHDLKSPFNVIQGFLSLIYTEFDDFSETDLKEIIKKTLDVSTNTFALLENLLDWSRSKRGKLELQKENINLCEACYEVICLNQECADTKLIQIMNKITADKVVFADKNMLRTILRNLLSNAIKFSHFKSTINIYASETEKMIEVCVEDHGIGMDEYQADSLFRINEKNQRVGTNKEKGTGLGLLLCKEFVEKNNGNLYVKSEVNKGSSFFFSLPKANSTNKYISNNIHSNH
ncbi:MAG: PAS domain S-box protein [Bacteroidales bacterium]|nr:PAS domain S-box protein [Bacteroidales bacterium]